MSLSLADKIYVAVSLIDFAGLFIWICICAHMGYTKIDVILEHLKRCEAVMMRASLRHGGIWGNLLLMGGISGFVTFPNFLIKKGLLDAEDLESLPVPIKRKLVRLQWSGLILLTIMVCLGVVAELDIS